MNLVLLTPYGSQVCYNFYSNKGSYLASKVPNRTWVSTLVVLPLVLFCDNSGAMA